MIVDIKVPSPGESITEVEIENWLVEDGSVVEMDAELAEINSDKATLTVNANASGKIKLIAKAGDTVSVGQVIATIDTAVAASSGDAPAQIPPKVELPKENNTVSEKTANPAAEKMIREQNLSAQNIEGTGKDGRITKTDVIQHINTPAAEVKTVTPAKTEKVDAPVVTPALSGDRTVRREKMSSLRRKVAQRLVSVKNETAMLTTFNEVDMQAIMDLRAKFKDKFKEIHGVGLGFMSFFTKACTMAIKEFPAVNAMIDGQDIVFHDYVDVGVAVSTERGLVVPNIRNAHLLSLAEIEKEIMAYALKARENKITIEDMTGGTFTITNGGVFGSMLSTPILNPPQVAILGMHNIVQRPVAINGEVKIRPIMYLALSYDHRIIDGKEAVSFLVRVKERLEDPSRLLLEI
ncbi:MAG: 2-oxoglutarate dehydrogenase complex dihydrolipoyllysine-residue succinyltransferase [Bacteroidia bacterium]|nr:2-oxoglutarate dehydrogenase complex dihydrolipoyllysine-residue succinyltransferase [Bacteroidia bacterium]